MNRTRILAAAAAITAVGVAALAGGALRETEGSAARVAPTQVESFQPSYTTVRNTAAFVADLESKLSVNPEDNASRVLLGLAYQQRARETGDFAFLRRSGRALREVLQRDERNDLAVSGLGSLSLTLHRFDEALAYGRRAVALAPGVARHFGVLGDALLETGNYREAFKSFDTMVRLKPSVSSYARVAYARELLGDHRGAIDAMRLAVDAAIGAREAMAWSSYQLGKLEWSVSRLEGAERAYRTALYAVPGYADALGGLAHIEAARGRLDRALALARRAFASKENAEHAMVVSELYRALGKTMAADRLGRRAIALEHQARRDGENSDLERALLQADLGIAPAATVRLAKSAYPQRRSIDGDDTVAWALYRAGRCAEALPYSKRALRLGTVDALKFFHRGMIERCLGNTRASKMWLGRALETNPHFSLRWAPVARRLA